MRARVVSAATILPRRCPSTLHRAGQGAPLETRLLRRQPTPQIRNLSRHRWRPACTVPLRLSTPSGVEGATQSDGPIATLGARDRCFVRMPTTGFGSSPTSRGMSPATKARISVDDDSEAVRPSKSGDPTRPAPLSADLTQRTFQSGVPLGHIRLYANECMYC